MDVYAGFWQENEQANFKKNDLITTFRIEMGESGGCGDI